MKNVIAEKSAKNAKENFFLIFVGGILGCAVGAVAIILLAHLSDKFIAAGVCAIPLLIAWMRLPKKDFLAGLIAGYGMGVLVGSAFAY